VGEAPMRRRREKIVAQVEPCAAIEQHRGEARAV